MASTALVRYWQSSAPSVAASSYNRGIVWVLMGATLLLDMRNVHDTSPLGVVAVRYATAPYASLLLSIKRVSYQAGHCWGQCLVPIPELPSPEEWGWTKSSSNTWQPEWMTIPRTSDVCKELVKCRF